MLRSSAGGDALRVIAVPRDENDVIAEERARLTQWAPSNGWSYVEYADAFDLLSRLSDLRAQRIVEIEIVAHGNPAVCDDINLENSAVVGGSLARISGIDDTDVYLSGCNTGLEFNGECVARSFAATYSGPVFGTRGYIAGTHAEGNERCVASFALDGIVYHGYPGAADAEHHAVWKQFGRPSNRSGGQVQIKIATSGFRTVNLSDPDGTTLVAIIQETIRTSPASSARMRMAADLTFAITLADGEHVFELLAGGSVLRDPVTRNVWQFERGQQLLRSLLPYRKLPAA